MTHTHAECQSFFCSLCLASDENLDMVTFKYYEELGEFFREFLVFYGVNVGKKCCSNRETNMPIILEEAIDCLIVRSRLTEEVRMIPPWKPLPDRQEEQTDDYTFRQLALLADAIADVDIAGMAGRLSNLLSAETYYFLIISKLKKWRRSLVVCGLIEGEY